MRKNVDSRSSGGILGGTVGMNNFSRVSLAEVYETISYKYKNKYKNKSSESLKIIRDILFNKCPVTYSFIEELSKTMYLDGPHKSLEIVLTERKNPLSQDMICQSYIETHKNCPYKVYETMSVFMKKVYNIHLKNQSGKL